MSSVAAPRAHLSAALVVIGDEVLTGKIRDTNSHWLAQELYALGASLVRVVVVPDRVEVIAQIVAELSVRCEAVFTSGGVGPTHDDVTYAGVARAFGLHLQRNDDLVRRMGEHYRGALNEERLKMADVPGPDELCFTEGMVTPVVRVRNVYILPGVPELFRQLFGALRERFRVCSVYLGQLYTRQTEGDIAAALNRVVRRHDAVRVGSYPRLDRAPYKVKITIESTSYDAAALAYRELSEALDRDAIVERDEVAVVASPQG